MNTRLIQFPGFAVSVREGWSDLTHTLGTKDGPFTLADPETGVGALQFSPAIYQSGPEPSPTLVDLRSMVAEFAKARKLGTAFDETVHSGDVSWASASFHREDDLVRVWYLSDRKNIVHVTYLCDWTNRSLEVEECEAILKSLRFM